MLLKVVGVVGLAVAISVAVVIFAIPRNNPSAPNVKFTDFSADRTDINVGESINVVFNVQNLESRAITDAKVVTTIDPSTYRPYLSIDKPVIALPPLQSMDARTGKMLTTITANSVPAKEAVYIVKGMLFAEGKQTDSREFELKIRE